jgi:hypothetical protein
MNQRVTNNFLIVKIDFLHATMSPLLVNYGYFFTIVSIELHAPTNSTQKLKLTGKGGHNSLILQHSPSRAGSPGRIRGILEWAVINFN